MIGNEPRFGLLQLVAIGPGPDLNEQQRRRKIEEEQQRRRKIEEEQQRRKIEEEQQRKYPGGIKLHVKQLIYIKRISRKKKH